MTAVDVREPVPPRPANSQAHAPAVVLRVLPLAGDDLDAPIGTAESDQEVQARETRPSCSAQVRSHLPATQLPQVVPLSYPLEGDERARAVRERTVCLHGQHLGHVVAQAAKEGRQLPRSPHEREPEVDAAALGAAQMVARRFALSIVPADVPFVEVLKGRVPDSEVDVLRGVSLMQAERPALAPVDPERARVLAE